MNKNIPTILNVVGLCLDFARGKRHRPSRTGAAAVDKAHGTSAGDEITSINRIIKTGTVRTCRFSAVTRRLHPLHRARAHARNLRDILFLIVLIFSGYHDHGLLLALYAERFAMKRPFNNPMLEEGDDEDADALALPAAEEVSRRDLEASLEAVAASDAVPPELKELVAKMDSFYKADAQRRDYESKPVHSDLMHEVPANW